MQCLMYTSIQSIRRPLSCGNLQTTCKGERLVSLSMKTNPTVTGGANFKCFQNINLMLPPTTAVENHLVHLLSSLAHVHQLGHLRRPSCQGLHLHHDDHHLYRHHLPGISTCLLAAQSEKPILFFAAKRRSITEAGARFSSTYTPSWEIGQYL